MIPLSPTAEVQLDALLAHYERLGRIEAAENLLTALERASIRISNAPGAGIPAPRPYPKLAALGLQWIKQGRYWVAYLSEPIQVIVGVYHEAADIPNRVQN